MKSIPPTYSRIALSPVASESERWTVVEKIRQERSNWVVFMLQDFCINIGLTYYIINQNRWFGIFDNDFITT